MSYVNDIYFTHEEFRAILEHFGQKIREKYYREKIPYESYRRLYRDCVKGVRMVEDEEGNFYFFDEDEAKYEEEKEYFATDKYGVKINRIVTAPTDPLILAMSPVHGFCDFLRNYYLVCRPDWNTPLKEIKEEDKDMRLNSNMTDWTVTWDNNSSTSNSNLAYNSNANKEYDCVWTTTQSPWTDVIDSWSIKLDGVDVGEALKELAGAAQSTAGAIGNIGNEIKKINDKNEKENTKMKGFNFDFGPCTNDNVRMSMYGIAVKNANNEWVSYNPATAQIVNVDIFNFEGGKYMFKMPVAPSQVVAGDVIIHNKKAMFVLDKDENGFVVVDPHAGEEKKVVPTSNCFNFNFVTKVVSMFDAFAAAPTPDAPFGNMLPLMMMDSNNKDFDPMMMMFMMNGGNMGDVFSNPMMMYFLMKDSGTDKDFMLPILMMQTMGQPASEAIKSNK